MPFSCRRTGKYWERVAAGPGNHVAVGLDTARASLVQAVEQGCGRTRAPIQLRAVAFGSAGVRCGGVRYGRRGGLGRSAGREPAIVVAAGTGVIAFGRDIRGHRGYASGRGWKVGDEGSAYWIAARALNAVSRSLDGRGRKTAMLEAMLASLRLSDRRALRDWTYAPGPCPGGYCRLGAGGRGSRAKGRCSSGKSSETGQLTNWL